MDEKEQRSDRYDRHPDMLKVAKELSAMTSGAGKVGFAITYTATRGNLNTHERFQKYCFENSNNEYLQGIKSLLDLAEVFDYFASFVEELDKVKLRLEALENGVQERETQGKGQEVKTF
jgi:hypothetical protein